jgi:hypothetical protein
MGNFAAYNIHQHMLHRLGLVKEVEYKEFPAFGPAIALALGETAIGYSDERGVVAGREVRETFFGEDLGLGVCWQHLGLGKEGGDKMRERLVRNGERS